MDAIVSFLIKRSSLFFSFQFNFNLTFLYFTTKFNLSLKRLVMSPIPRWIAILNITFVTG